jgi:RNA polymerase sigma-70 factor (ECF subfamily)
MRPGRNLEEQIASKKMTTKTLDLQALRRREAAAFQQLVETYSPRIYNLALKMLGNPDLAEDILQETFINAYKAIDRFEGRAHVSTWLYRIAHNAVLMRLRKEKRAPDIQSLDDELDLDTLTITDGRQDAPERRLLQAELIQKMDQALAELSETLRVVFILRDIEGLSTVQTAEALDLSETAVKSRLHRARLALRAQLAPYLQDHQS